MIIMFNYCEKHQIFALPGNFYFTTEDFRNGVETLTNDDSGLHYIRKPLRSWLKQELPNIRVNLFDFATQIQSLTHFEFDMVIFLIGLKMSRAHAQRLEKVIKWPTFSRRLKE